MKLNIKFISCTIITIIVFYSISIATMGNREVQVEVKNKKNKVTLKRTGVKIRSLLNEDGRMRHIHPVKNIEISLEKAVVKIIKAGKLVKEIKSKKYPIAIINISKSGERIVVLESREYEGPPAAKLYFYDSLGNEVGSFEDESLRDIAWIALSENGKFVILEAYEKNNYHIKAINTNNNLIVWDFIASGHSGQISNDGNILAIPEKLYKRGRPSEPIKIGDHYILSMDSEGHHIITYYFDNRKIELLDIRNETVLWSYELSNIIKDNNKFILPVSMLITEKDKYSIIIIRTDKKKRIGKMIIISKNGEVVAEDNFVFESTVLDKIYTGSVSWSAINSMFLTKNRLTIINNENIYEYEITEIEN